KKSAFIATKSTTMLPIAIVWLCFDLGFIGSLFADGEGAFFLIPFFLLHMMPVWIWLANVITAGRRYTNTGYYVTNRRIVIQHGFLAINEVSLFYKDLQNVQTRIGFVDKIFHVGDICFDSGVRYDSRGNKQNEFVFEELEDVQEVYARIQKIILDMQTDIEYPNDLRPKNNSGYNTQYRP
ncbi:MAG: PH domain-containing protein, partial [Clostridia bacterium]|nr:PH domain-containing protein [Clostridia bacterium]